MSDIKRLPPRFPVDMSARFRSAEGENAEWREGRLLNLSEGGLCLKADSESLMPGEILEIVIDSVDKKGIARRRLLRAKVVWRKADKAGVQFMRSRLLPRARPRNAKKTADRGRPKLSLARDEGGDEE